MGNLIRHLSAKLQSAPSLEPGSCRIPSSFPGVGDAEEVGERKLDEFQVAHIQNPGLGHIEGPDDVKLFPH